MIERILEILHALPAATARAHAKEPLPDDPYLSYQVAGLDHPLVGVHKSLPEGHLNILMSQEGTLYAAYWEKDAEELGIHGYHMLVTRYFEAATALGALPDSPFGKRKVDVSWMQENMPAGESEVAEESEVADGTSDLIYTIQSEATSDSEAESNHHPDPAEIERIRKERALYWEDFDEELGQENPRARQWREAIAASVADAPPERQATELPFRRLLDDIPLCGDRPRLNPEEEAALRATFEAALRAVV